MNLVSNHMSRRFGRGRTYVMGAPVEARSEWLNDVALFATTFAGGLLFMTIYLG